MKKVRTDPLKLTIGWLYPAYMSTYGDRGNIIILRKRCARYGFEVTVRPIDAGSSRADISGCDIIFGGGAQDRQQMLVSEDLRRNKGPVLKEMFARGVPGLFVCGSPQLFGNSYMTGDGTVIPGVGIFNIESKHFGHDKPRLIGNLVIDIGSRYRVPGLPYENTVVGFENHGGRTYLGEGVEPFGTVITGSGNNGEDGTEGARWKNCLATYSHGPLLSKNPHLADWVINTAVTVRYGAGSWNPAPLDDTFAWLSHRSMLDRLQRV